MLKMAVFALTGLSLLVAARAANEGRAYITDGDTIAIEGFETYVALDSIDALESAQPCYNAVGERYLCGSDAAEELADIIGRNGPVRCVERERDRDRYRRIVAQCFVGDTDIRRELMLRGRTVQCMRYSDGRYAEVEAEAKAVNRGLSVVHSDEPPLWWQRGADKLQGPQNGFV